MAQRKKPQAAPETPSTSSEAPASSSSSDTAIAIPAAEAPNSQLTPILVLLKTVYLIVVLGLTQYASQKALTPLYGSTTTSQNYDMLFVMSMCVSLVLPTTAEMEGTLWNILAGVLCLAPYSAYTFGAWTARQRDAFLGPLIAQLPLSAPVAIAANLIIRINFINLLRVSHESRVARILVFLTTSAWVQMTSGFISAVASRRPPYAPYSECSVFFATGVSSLFISALLLAVNSGRHFLKSFGGSPSTGGSSRARTNAVGFKAAGLVLNLALLWTSQSNRPCTTPIYPYVSGKKGEVRVLASANSVTGRIVVAENMKDGFRYLRCDHSILGGVWLGEDKIAALSSTKEKIVPAGGVDLIGTRLGESIYSAFVLQDAMRLFERKAASPTLAAGQSALVIGMGMGVMARSLDQIGIKATILEIDPVVQAFAQNFFAAPKQKKPEGVTTKYLIDPLTPQTHIGDARDFIETRAQRISPSFFAAKDVMKYDYVVHDCFSGGMVPAHLFTKEFWWNTKMLMKDDGIIAVNFAGHASSNSSRAILTTLEDSFAKCRVFHDMLRHKDAPRDDGFLDSEIVNLVFFCTQSDDMQLSLRKPRDSDYLDSRVRQHIFKNLEYMEVPRSRIMGSELSSKQRDNKFYLLTDARNPLYDWQVGVALEHWKLMRMVLSDEMWEAY
ncbi:hypothetical protein FRB96_000474 [Tulasnella sp. 330]|nr:hypothetical protein FRB96_000474 [Tulasnella sp. 330]KAG8883058.1 hypothetical protein FRB97_007323 [Tulasnella sp. 331]